MEVEKNMSKRVLVTAALPYTNYTPHLGHIAGAYLPADIFARFCKLKGYETLYICGSDEHGTPIEVAAFELGIEPFEYSDFFKKKQLELFRKLNIEFDIYSGTAHSKVHYKLTQEFFLYLFKAKLIKEEIQVLPYDPEAKKFLPDRYVIGKCPYCGYEKARGDQCENCGRLLDPSELINPRSVITGKPVIFKESKHLFIRFPELKKDLEEFIEGRKEIWRENVYSWSKAMLKELKDRPITRDIKWGVPIPYKEMAKIIAERVKELGISKENIERVFEEFGLLWNKEREEKLNKVELNENNLEEIIANLLEEYSRKVFYVWFDAPIGYISFTIEKTPNFREFWEEGKSYIFHFIGKDNIPFHTIFWPGMIIGRNKGYLQGKLKETILDFVVALPYNVVGNQYLNFKGRKFSKSQKWGVFLDKIEESGIPADYYRFYLAYILPEKKDSNFDWEQFREIIEKELIGNFGNFANRVLTFIWKNFDGIVPEPSSLGEDDKAILDLAKELPNKVFELVWKAELSEALKEILRVSDIGNKYFQEKEPWKLVKENKEKAKAVLFVSFNLIKNLAILLYPYIPEKAKELLEIMNIELNWENLEKEFYNHKIKQPRIVFPKLSKEVWENAEKITSQVEDYTKYLTKHKYKAIALLEWEGKYAVIESEVNTSPWEAIEEKLKELRVKYLKDSVVGEPTPDFVINRGRETLFIYKIPLLKKPKDLEFSEEIPIEELKGKVNLISYSDFAKLDIKVGKILEVKDHPNADKLYVMKVDLGGEVRTLVGGLKGYYSKEELEGKTVIVLANLKPKELRGIESKGMLLAADDGERVALLMPDKEVKLGSKIR